eukprot:EG_transcript_17845
MKLRGSPKRRALSDVTNRPPAGPPPPDRKPTAAPEDCMGHWHALEEQSRPPPDFLARQPECTAAVRLTVVDWLVRICDNEEIRDESFFLAVNLMDRVLGARQVPKEELLLVALAAVMVACKYEEYEAPAPAQLVGYTGHAWEVAELLQMERLILQTLNYQLNGVTPLTFLVRYLHVLGPSHPKLRNTAIYISKAALMKPSILVGWPASVVAAAAVHLACQVLGVPLLWTAIPVRCSQRDVLKCAKLLWDVVQKMPESRFQNLTDLYSSLRMDRVTRQVEAADLHFPGL